VFAEISRLPGWVTGVALNRNVRIPGNPTVFCVHVSPVVFVASDALERAEVVRVDVTDRAGIPRVFVPSRKDWEPRVVVRHQRRAPTGHFVAILTQYGETG
jgi:hypothetical protein